jgi:hypothetical protein
MQKITVEVFEAEVIAWVQKLSLEGKREILRLLLSDTSVYKVLVDQSNQWTQAEERDIDWAKLFASEHHHLVEKMLREDKKEANAPLLKSRRITELAGLGADIWENIDAQEYVNQLRDEWDEQL